MQHQPELEIRSEPPMLVLSMAVTGFLFLILGWMSHGFLPAAEPTFPEGKRAFLQEQARILSDLTRIYRLYQEDNAPTTPRAYLGFAASNIETHLLHMRPRWSNRVRDQIEIDTMAAVDAVLGGLHASREKGPESSDR